MLLVDKLENLIKMDIDELTLLFNDLNKHINDKKFEDAFNTCLDIELTVSNFSRHIQNWHKIKI